MNMNSEGNNGSSHASQGIMHVFLYILKLENVFLYKDPVGKDDAMKGGSSRE